MKLRNDFDFSNDVSVEFRQLFRGDPKLLVHCSTDRLLLVPAGGFSPDSKPSDISAAVAFLVPVPPCLMCVLLACDRGGKRQYATGGGERCQRERVVQSG